ncbi:MAG: hypothetical protein FIA96_15200 [Betaproteobacteria bacterium]|nr:hypothetical protein [Betaproteobacteria bacterium]
MASRLQTASQWILPIGLVVFALPASGNPINPLQIFPPFPPTLVAILLEAVVVTLIVRRTSPALRWCRFLALWYVVNLLTVYGVGGVGLPAVTQHNFILGLILFELVVLALEWQVLEWLYGSWGVKVTKRQGWVAVIIGNAVLFVAVAPIHHVWPEALMPEIYRPTMVE